MRKYFKGVLVLVAATVFGCDSDDFTEPDYVSFQAEPASVLVDFGGTASYDIRVYTGNITSSDRTFELEVESATTLPSEAYSVPSTVTVPGGSNEGILTIELSDSGIDPNGDNLRIGFAPRQSGYVGEDINVAVGQFCDPQLVFNFVFDGYASETTWIVEDSEGETVLSGGPWSDGTSSASVARCLGPGDYVFTVYDAYGDGLTYPTTGSITLLYGGEELAVIPGNFGAEGSVSFTLD